MSLDDLKQSDIQKLAELLSRSQQSRERRALCIELQIDHRQLNFIENHISDWDFFLLLISYLKETGKKDTLCNICSKQVLPDLLYEQNRDELEDIIKILGCGQSTTTTTKKSIRNLNKNNFLFMFISTFFLILLASILFLISFYKSQHRFIKNDKPQHRFIENDLSGKCIDVVGAPGRAIGTPLQLWDCETSGRNLENDSATDQQWIFTEDGFIMNVLSGKCIDVAGAPGRAIGTPLQLWDCETSGRNLENGSLTDQRWTFIK
ncbi:RICIN domain-containing protein, partial [Microcoleus sp. ZQ-A2]|nr:ricin-type beta-trefoil lectin domain protein [Microcoleus sp. FACHB-1]